MSLIYLDTMLFAYLLEDHPQLGQKVADTIHAILQRQDRLCTSVFTVGEVLAGPQRTHQWDALASARQFFHRPEIRLLPFELGTAELFAELRGRYALSTGDAIHLACASEARVDLFLTHDKRLAKKTIPGIGFLASLDSNVFQ